jgi:hypothetical protein
MKKTAWVIIILIVALFIVYFNSKSGINPYLRWQEFWLQDECLDKGGQWTPSGCLFKEKQ